MPLSTAELQERVPRGFDPDSRRTNVMVWRNGGLFQDRCSRREGGGLWIPEENDKPPYYSKTVSGIKGSPEEQERVVFQSLGGFGLIQEVRLTWHKAQLREIGRVEIYVQGALEDSTKKHGFRLNTTRLITANYRVPETEARPGKVIEPGPNFVEGYEGMTEVGQKAVIFDIYTAINILRADEGLDPTSL